MKEIIETMTKKDIIAFQKEIKGKQIHALEAYFDEKDGKTSVILYQYKHKKVKHFYFNEKIYTERIMYYQAICDSLIASCGVNKGDPSDRTVHFKPKHSKRIRSIIIWYKK